MRADSNRESYALIALRLRHPESFCLLDFVLRGRTDHRSKQSHRRHDLPGFGPGDGGEVQLPAKAGQMELLVTPLPDQTIDSSLYSEAGDGIRVLATRYRMCAILQDTRTEVRTKQDQIKSLQADAEKMQKQVQVIDQNLQLLGKLEGFTAATMNQLAEKGLLSADSTIAPSKFVMDQRSQRSDDQVKLQQQIRDNAEAQEFAQRELAELTAGTTRTERNAVIVIDKPNAAAGTIRLNYLVSAASWQPTYKLRASGEQGPVQVEYLAAVVQQSGEDWNDASIVLSTAEPELTAAPPELTALDVTVNRTSAGGGFGGGVAGGIALDKDNREHAKQLRGQAQQLSLQNSYVAANSSINSGRFGTDR